MIIKRTLFSLVTIIGLTFFISAIALIIDGLNDHLGQSDVGIVLGSKVEIDGNPSARLKARLDKTISLYRAGYFNAIIVSGGFGKEGFDEAEVMRGYLIQHHIPSTAILMDPKGNTTQATAQNSYRIMQEHGFKTAMIITQYFHISRTKLAMTQCDISDVYHAHPDFFEWRDLYSIPREVIASFVKLM